MKRWTGNRKGSLEEKEGDWKVGEQGRSGEERMGGVEEETESRERQEDRGKEAVHREAGAEERRT